MYTPYHEFCLWAFVEKKQLIYSGAGNSLKWPGQWICSHLSPWLPSLSLHRWLSFEAIVENKPALKIIGKCTCIMDISDLFPLLLSIESITNWRVTISHRGLVFQPQKRSFSRVISLYCLDLTLTLDNIVLLSHNGRKQDLSMYASNHVFHPMI